MGSTPRAPGDSPESQRAGAARGAAAAQLFREKLRGVWRVSDGAVAVVAGSACAIAGRAPAELEAVGSGVRLAGWEASALVARRADGGIVSQTSMGHVVVSLPFASSCAKSSSAFSDELRAAGRCTFAGPRQVCGTATDASLRSRTDFRPSTGRQCSTDLNLSCQVPWQRLKQVPSLWEGPE